MSRRSGIPHLAELPFPSLEGAAYDAYRATREDHVQRTHELCPLETNQRMTVSLTEMWGDFELIAAEPTAKCLLLNR